MAKLSGKGAPTRKTIGGLGDIYTDITTGQKYECTFAYRDDTDADFDCQWRKLKSEKTNKKPYTKPEINIPEIVEEVAEPEVVEEAVEKVTKNAAPKRTNYAAYGKKKK